MIAALTERNAPVMKHVTIGPVRSSYPALDDDFRDYLKANGFTTRAGGIDWEKEFPDAISADAGKDAALNESALNNVQVVDAD